MNAIGPPPAIAMTHDELQTQLAQWIDRWHIATENRQRAKLLQQILSAMNRSGKIWRGAGVPRDLYEEALQENWLWFTQHLADYDSKKAAVMSWFNQYLKWKIADLQKERDRDAKHRWQSPSQEEGQPCSVEDFSQEHLSQDMVKATDSRDFETALEQVKRCIACHQWQLRRRSMRGRPEVSCDRILAALLERVEHAPSSVALSDLFAQLASDWQLERDTLRRFTSSSCFKLIRQLCPFE